MRATLTVARELLRCRLQEGGRDLLLERVAELLDVATLGAPPFCFQLPPQAPVGPCSGPLCAHAPSGVPQGFMDTSTSIGAGRQAAPAPPPVNEGMRIAAYGPGGLPPYHPQDGALVQATWSVGHYSEVFEAATSEAYVPHMVDWEYELEDDPGSFLGSGWEEETPEAEPF